MAKTRQTVLSQSRPQLISPTCAVCAQLVTAHFDNRGRFVGCKPTVLFTRILHRPLPVARS